MSCINLSVLHMFIATCLFCFQIPTTTANNVTERLALLDIKSKISDPLGVMNSWKDDTIHFCKWYGVTCARSYEGVTILDLHFSRLTGTLSPHVGNLSFLIELRLNNNSFGGTIPPQIGRLHRLKTLSMSNNFFVGEIPSNLSSCYSLIALNLVSNNLVGAIPPSFGSLPHLEYLSLTLNNLTGNIPLSLGNLSTLSQLYLGKNKLFGSISSLGKLNNLTVLILEENKFHGTVPHSIFNLSLLTNISLRQNEFHGSLPSDLGNSLPRLKFLSLDTNQFSGHIPASLSNSSNLQVLQLMHNNLQGLVPSLHKLTRLSHLVLSNNSLGYNQPGDLDFIFSLANATNMEWLEIDRNNLNGVFPQIICNFSSITYLVIYSNNIAGEIPECIEKLSKMQNFVAYDNLLSGVIPSSIGKLGNLYNLILNSNHLSGVIPDSIGNLTRLSTFSLSTNNLEGQIPSSIGYCTLLTSIYLANNSLSGHIPSQLFNLPSLSEQVDLSSNQLIGPLSEDVGQLNNLNSLLLTDNKLSGQIPSSLSSCIALEFLFLGKNHFHGTIPDSLSSLKGLFVLDLSYNNLSGAIPQFLASLQLRLLNLSHNNLEGEVPVSGAFNDTSTVLVSHNSRLCGGIPELQLPHCSTRRPSHKKKLIIVVVSGFVGVILLMVVLLLLYFFWHKKKTAYKKPASFGYLENFPNLSYDTLFKATNGFSSENLIASGTFGDVYKGMIKGSIVAVKVYKLESHGALKSFMAECEVLRRIRHRNLLKVITACSSVDYQGRDFKALICEYMVNGSLDDWLHPTREIFHVEGTCFTSENFDLRRGLDIAIDVAFALEYLHHHCDPPIVHCDIKPSNMLLDDQMVAHIGDFGLAMIIRHGVDTHHANQSSSIGVKGTIGYTPPEYGLGNDVSTSGDVYSFGILLLEMLTGIRPTNDMFEGGLSLHSIVKQALPKNITTIVSQTMLHGLDEDDIESKLILEALISILRVGLSCSFEVPQDRLNMSDVVTMLVYIRNNLLTIASF